MINTNHKITSDHQTDSFLTDPQRAVHEDNANKLKMKNILLSRGPAKYVKEITLRSL